MFTSLKDVLYIKPLPKEKKLKKPPTIRITAEYARLFGPEVALIAGAIAENDNEWVTLSELEDYLWLSKPKITRAISTHLEVKVAIGIFKKGFIIRDEKPKIAYKLIDLAYKFIKQKRCSYGKKH